MTLNTLERTNQSCDVTMVNLVDEGHDLGARDLYSGHQTPSSGMGVARWAGNYCGEPSKAEGASQGQGLLPATNLATEGLCSLCESIDGPEEDEEMPLGGILSQFTRPWEY